MDPNLFYINYERTLEVFVTIVVLSMMVERTLSLVFESKPFIDKTKEKHGLKEIISFAVSVLVCIFWKFDAVTIILVTSDKMTYPGMILSGGIVAGGSKASIALFKDWLGFMSSAEKERKAIKKAELEKKIQAV